MKETAPFILRQMAQENDQMSQTNSAIAEGGGLNSDSELFMSHGYSSDEAKLESASWKGRAVSDKRRAVRNMQRIRGSGKQPY